jgi:cytoskeletal protein CcmA (bactofilin family)
MDNGPKPVARPSDANAILGKGSEFEGKLTFEGTVRIEGKFTGEIISEGSLIIGEGARVKAEISVDTVIIEGDVLGNVKVGSLVDLRSTARLKGNIQAPGLSVHQGAVFDGNCSMGSLSRATEQI